MQLLLGPRAADRAPGGALFDQTRGIHGLTDREREWIEYAALLHDIGVHISYRGASQALVLSHRNGDLRGFEPDEIEMIALVARYHRRRRQSVSTMDYARSAASASAGRSHSVGHPPSR